MEKYTPEISKVYTDASVRNGMVGIGVFVESLKRGFIFQGKEAESLEAECMAIISSMYVMKKLNVRGVIVNDSEQAVLTLNGGHNDEKYHQYNKMYQDLLPFVKHLVVRIETGTSPNNIAHRLSREASEEYLSDGCFFW